MNEKEILILRTQAKILLIFFHFLRSKCKAIKKRLLASLIRYCRSWQIFDSSLIESDSVEVITQLYRCDRVLVKPQYM